MLSLRLVKLAHLDRLLGSLKLPADCESMEFWLLPSFPLAHCGRFAYLAAYLGLSVRLHFKAGNLPKQTEFGCAILRCLVLPSCQHHFMFRDLQAAVRDSFGPFAAADRRGVCVPGQERQAAAVHRPVARMPMRSLSLRCSSV